MESWNLLSELSSEEDYLEVAAVVLDSEVRMELLDSTPV